MLNAPGPAAKKVLARAGMTLDDIDLFEVNEAFGSVPLSWAKALDADMSKLNVNGGAQALGHPPEVVRLWLRVDALWHGAVRKERVSDCMPEVAGKPLKVPREPV